MTRYLAIFAMLGFLALPFMVGAEETSIPPEANWSPTPPARGTVPTPQKRAAIRPQEQARIGQSAVATPIEPSRQLAQEPDSSYRTSP